MFEPLKEILNRHGATFAEHLAAIRGSLAEIVGNTNAQIQQTQRKTYSIVQDDLTGKSVPREKQTLRNQTGNDWIIRYISAMRPGWLFKGINGQEGFVWASREELESEVVDIFVPAGGTLIWEPNTFTERSCINLEVEELIPTHAPAHTGPSDEHIEVMRREPVPSGTPLDTPVADDPPPAARV